MMPLPFIRLCASPGLEVYLLVFEGVFSRERDKLLDTSAAVGIYDEEYHSDDGYDGYYANEDHDDIAE